MAKGQERAGSNDDPSGPGGERSRGEKKRRVRSRRRRDEDIQSLRRYHSSRSHRRQAGDPLFTTLAYGVGVVVAVSLCIAFFQGLENFYAPPDQPRLRKQTSLPPQVGTEILALIHKV
jgi:hypothetical protein